MKKWILALLLLGGTTAEARKFSFDNEGFSTYLRGGGGLSNAAKDAYGKSSGADTVFEDKVEFNFSGEVGVALSISQLVLRVGVEGIVPKKLSGIEGKKDTDVLFTLDSEILAVAPTVAAEFALYQDAQARFMVGGSVGRASVEIKNTYFMKAAGITELGVANDFVEVAKATVLGGSIFAGIESLFTDNVTFSLDVGYRHYQITGFTHAQAATTINGTVAEGDAVLNTDGSDRTLNLSGLYVSVGLRFYIAL